ncbi:MAG: hypothetical protein ACNYZG_00890 [Gammaproteobacteria bacterium]
MFSIIPVTILIGGLFMAADEAQAGESISNKDSYYQVVDGSCYDLADAEHIKGNEGCDSSAALIPDNSPYYVVVDGACFDSGDKEHMLANADCGYDNHLVTK